MGAEASKSLTAPFGLHAGGSPYSVIAILDTLKTIKPDVSTIAFGQSLSTATLLLVSPATPVGVMLPSSHDCNARLNTSRMSVCNATLAVLGRRRLARRASAAPCPTRGS